MRTALPVEWPTETRRMHAIQRQLAARVRLAPLPSGPALVAGLAAAPGDESPACAAAVVTDARGQVVESVAAGARAPSGYEPGVLALAVGPACLAALAMLRRSPDLVFVLGHGIAHPRRCGLASHLGVLLDVPTIGCADRPLAGQAVDPARHHGARAPLLHGRKHLGVVLRTSGDGRPIVVSPGHRVSCEQAAELALAHCRGGRWPEPIRLARLELRRWRREHARE